MSGLALPPSLATDGRSIAHISLIERLAALDLSQLLVYRLDTLADDLLAPLAWQFDMLAPQWQLGVVNSQPATGIDNITDWDTLKIGGQTPASFDVLGSNQVIQQLSVNDQLRQLLQVAIPLHKVRGTVGSISTALQQLGWATISIQEGQNTWGGTQWPSNQGWAAFRVLIYLEDGQTVSATQVGQALSAIKFFKNARSWLDSIWFVLPAITDNAPAPTDIMGGTRFEHDLAPTPTDVYSGVWPARTDPKQTIFDHNAHFRWSGTLTHDGTQPAVADAVVVNGKPVDTA